MEVAILRPWLKRIAEKAGLSEDEAAALVERPPERAMGDFAVPCFRFAKALRKAPQAIAAEMASEFEAVRPVVKIEAKGPYLNFFLDAAFRAESVLRPALEGAAFGVPQSQKDAPPIVVEYSSPNIAKPFGVGHLRTTVIGNSLARLFEAQGRRVVRLNFPGDWGTQFGLLLAQWVEDGKKAPTEFDMLVIGEILDAYVRANRREEEDAEFAARARKWFERLEKGDQEAVALWEAFRARSMDYFNAIYTQLGILPESFDETEGEAFIARHPEWVQKVLDTADGKGIARKSEGALIIDLDKFDMPPVMLLKSDGTTTYHTRDLAAALYRWDKYGFERMFYVVGLDQTLHFRQISKGLELLEIEPAGRIEHVPFGLIRFGEGKMSTRAGNVVMLQELLNELHGRVMDIILKNYDIQPEDERQIGPDVSAYHPREGTPLEKDLSDMASQVALGALIFEDLGRRRIKDVDFDWDRALNLTGDTGPYLQYTYARLRSIERKAGEAGIAAVEPDFSLLSGDEEDEVLNLLAQAPETLGRAVEEREPSVLASYLLSLAGAVNHFYNVKRVLGEEAGITQARLALVKGVCEAVGVGLFLLGIPAPERM